MCKVVMMSTSISRRKIIVLKIFLRVSALIQAIYWGGSHLIAPQWYLNSIGLSEVPASGFVLVAMHEIGVLSMGAALATGLASLDPIRNFAVIIMLCFLALGSIAVSVTHILLVLVPPGEWATVIIIGVQLTALAGLYPWRQAWRLRTKGLLYNA